MRILALAAVLLLACGGARAAAGIDCDVHSDYDFALTPRERNAETLCLKLQDLDRIDDALEYRHQGKPLDLLQVRVGTRAAAAD